MARKRRDRTAAKIRRHKVDLEALAPKVALGITEGASAREAMQELDERMGRVSFKDGVDLVQSHLGGEQERIGRIPVPRFVATDDTHSVWKDEQTNRLQRNAILKMDRETYEAILAGHICLRCLEPQPDAFPDQCDLCGYPMQERQALDVRMEFRGEDHIGPGMPIAQWEAEQEEKAERAEHARRKREGGSPMKTISRRVLSPGAKRLRGLTGKVYAGADVVKEMEKADHGKKD